MSFLDFCRESFSDAFLQLICLLGEYKEIKFIVYRTAKLSGILFYIFSSLLGTPIGCRDIFTYSGTSISIFVFL